MKFIPFSKKPGTTFIYAIRFAICLTALMLLSGCTDKKSERRKAIDPNQERVMVKIGEIDFDIPLGYFYEKIVWAKGEWPIPLEHRITQPSITIMAYIDGMRPWSKELGKKFKNPGSLEITRLTIKGDYPNNWLDNFLRYRVPTQRPSSEFGSLPGLSGYTSDYDPKGYYYLPLDPGEQPFSIRCSRANPNSGYCYVTFAYRSPVVVEYMIPIYRLKDWQGIHRETIQMLDSFVKPELTSLNR